MHAWLRAKSADLSYFQRAISLGYWESLLPNTQQRQCVLSATQACATCACAKASACVRYLQRSSVSTWISPKFC